MSERLQTVTAGVSQETLPLRGAAVAFIFITVLLDMLALGLIMPILPKLVESFVADDTARAARIFGLFGTAWALMQFASSPILGSLSDGWATSSVQSISQLLGPLLFTLMLAIVVALRTLAKKSHPTRAAGLSSPAPAAGSSSAHGLDNRRACRSGSRTAGTSAR
jgi:MFS family permease